MKRKIITIAAACVMCVTICGCGGTAGESHNGIVVTTSLDDKDAIVGNIECDFPLVDEDTNLNVMITGRDGVNQEDVYVWKKYSQMTGVNINWTTMYKDNRDESVRNALIKGKNLDLIIRGKIPSKDLTQYGEGGYILDLAKDDMLKKYAPNFWAYCQSHPDTLASIMNPDGSIYAMPQVNSGSELRVSRKIFINKTWLKNVNMDIPKTTDEFYELLKAFSEKDSNGNGNLNDEIPLSSADWLSIQETFLGSFGLGNRGVHNLVVDYDKKTGGARFIAASDEYKAYLEYFQKLYSQGLIDSNIFTMTSDLWSSNIEEDKVGVFVNTNLAGVPADKADNWVAVKEPLAGPFGDKLCSPIRANFHSTGAAVIPVTCDNPELVLKWLDYFWTDEGTLFYHMGIEDKTFVAKKDGSYDYTEKIYNRMKKENITFDSAVEKITPYPGGSNPTVETAPYFMGGEMAKVPAEAARSLFEYGPEEYWPSFTFTAAENEKLDVIQEDIEKYTVNSEIEFISGVKSLSGWDSYKAQLDKLKVSELLGIYQSAVDRYNKIQK